MTFNYASTAATALRLLQRFGLATTFKRTASAAYDPSTGTSAETTTTLDTTAAVFDYKQGYVDGTLIRQGDRYAILSHQNEPKQGDKFTWEGADFDVVNVKPLAPSGVKVIYEVQIRG